MKNIKKSAVLFSCSIVIILGIIAAYISFSKEKSAPDDIDLLITNVSITEEEKEQLTEKAILEHIEETLNQCDFETEEEKNHYRELLLDYFLK